MSEDCVNTRTYGAQNWLGLTVLAAAPYLLLQLIIAGDPGILAAFAYFFLPALVILIVFWFVYLFVELRWLHQSRLAEKRAPEFSIVGAVALLIMFPMYEWARPYVMDVPEWCRVSQTARWEASSENLRYRANDALILVLSGQGNREEHRFTGGYLNWTGEGKAGFARMQLDPLQFGRGYHDALKPGTHDGLRANLALTGLPPKEVDQLANSIWLTLETASTNSVVAAVDGQTSDLFEAVADYQNFRLGGAVWTIGLLLIFGCIARRAAVTERAILAARADRAESPS